MQTYNNLGQNEMEQQTPIPPNITYLWSFWAYMYFRNSEDNWVFRVVLEESVKLHVPSQLHVSSALAYRVLPPIL